KQYTRNNNLWNANQDNLPVFGTIASQFNDTGMNDLYRALIAKLKARTEIDLNIPEIPDSLPKRYIIPPSRTRYLSEIVENNRAYDQRSVSEAKIAQQLFGIYKTIESVSGIRPSLEKNGLEIGKALIKAKE